MSALELTKKWNSTAGKHKAGNSLVNYQLTISWTDSSQSVESYPFSLLQFEVWIVGLKPLLTFETDS